MIMKNLMTLIGAIALVGGAAGTGLGKIASNANFNSHSYLSTSNETAQEIIDKIVNTNINIPNTVPTLTTSPATISALKAGLQKANPSLTASELATLVFSQTTLSTTAETPVNVTALSGGTVASKEINVKMDAVNPAQEIINKITNKNVSLPAGTDPNTATPATINALKTALKTNNPNLTPADLASLVFQQKTLIPGANNLTVSAFAQGSIASTTLTVTLQKSSGKVVTDLAISNITNSQFASLQAPNPSADINYNAPAYTPWYDDGFNWYQFLDNSGTNAGIGDTVINKILSSTGQTKVINLGFITGFDINDKTATSQLAVDFKQWAQTQATSKKIAPSIGGILPLWMANWTDRDGSPKPTSATTNIYQFLSKIRAAGYDFTFSFGGWNHDSLAMAAELDNYTPQQLADVYGSIIKQMNLKSVNFDIEGTEAGRTDDFGNKHPLAQGEAAQKLRFQALEILKSDPQFDDVHINVTFPTLTSVYAKSTDQQFANAQMLQYIQSGIASRVTIMAFDTKVISDQSVRTTLPGENALYQMSAVNSLANYFKDNGVQNPYSKIGLVSMAGVNDQPMEIWTVTDEALIVDFAIEHHLASLDFWSVIRDMGNQIWSHPAFHTGHTLDTWNYAQMRGVSKTIKADSYNNGLGVKDLTYSNLARRFSTQSLYNFNGKIPISKSLWEAIKARGILPNIDPVNITSQDITSLYSTNFFFSDNTGLQSYLSTLTTTEALAALNQEVTAGQFSQFYKGSIQAG